MDRSKFKIVVVDDEELVLNMLRESLENAGFSSLTCFTDPFQAQAHIKENPVDAVFSDFSMPGLNGVQLLEAVTAACKKFLVTGSFVLNPELRRDCEKRGIIGIEKPFHPEELINHLTQNRQFEP